LLKINISKNSKANCYYPPNRKP